MHGGEQRAKLEKIQKTDFGPNWLSIRPSTRLPARPPAHFARPPGSEAGLFCSVSGKTSKKTAMQEKALLLPLKGLFPAIPRPWGVQRTNVARQCGRSSPESCNEKRPDQSVPARDVARGLAEKEY